jgi:hypothetical protein
VLTEKPKVIYKVSTNNEGNKTNMFTEAETNTATYITSAILKIELMQ